MAKNWCKCPEHNTKDFVKLTDFYCKNFIPDNWRLDYTTLHEQEENRTLYIEGHCNDCRGFMQSGSGISTNNTDKNLIKEIWNAFNSYRPFLNSLTERNDWYEHQDEMPQEYKTVEFVSLFKELDREYVSQTLQEILDEQNKINVLIVEPMEKPYAKIIDKGLESMQSVVGGWIECVGFDENDYNITLVCNEEGKLEGLVGNRKIGDDIIAGTFFITKSNDEGEFVSLSQSEIDKYSDRFIAPEKYTDEDVENSIYIEVYSDQEQDDEDLEG